MQEENPKAQAERPRGIIGGCDVEGWHQPLARTKNYYSASRHLAMTPTQEEEGVLRKCQVCGKETPFKNCSKNCKWKIANIRSREKRRAGEKRRYHENSLKVKARSALRYAVETGRISKEPCKVCGSIKVEGHHQDHSKPLEADWLCRKHHMQAHGFMLKVKSL